MPLSTIKCTDFRCLASAEFSPDPRYSLVYGANASGKTSLLEAIAYLGRGRSFRGAASSALVRNGAREFVLFGKAVSGTREVSLGVKNGPGGLEIHIDGESASSAAGLAEVLPLQVVDPDVHNLVAGGPDERRRYLDWIAFHVEHGFVDQWRRFRRALKQRNAALRDGAAERALAGWDQELAATGGLLHEARQRVLEMARPALEATGSTLLGCAVTADYARGWASDQSLQEALRGSVERDRQTGNTQAGPHRADLKLRYDERQARRLVSRGQQKLLACALVLAAVEVVQRELGRPLTLLLDDPAAELDEESLQRLMNAVAALDSQVIATALTPDSDLFPAPPKLFHVEHGQLQQVDCQG